MDQHEKNRSLVCVLCLSKASSLRPITEGTRDFIRIFLQDFQSRENLYPLVICGTCRVACGAYAKECTRVPKIHNFNLQNSITTRSQGMCKCEICVAAGTREGRSNLPGFKSKNLKRGRPKSSTDTEGISGRKAMVICETCYSKYGRGNRHRCNQFTRASNLKSMMKHGESSSNSADAAVADYMRTKSESPGKTIFLVFT